jgi:hypothetical protein
MKYIKTTKKKPETPVSNTGVILTQFYEATPRLDWLSFTFGGALNFLSNLNKKIAGKKRKKEYYFQAIDTGNSTRNFQNFAELFFCNFHLADVQFNCKLPNLKDILIIKLKNEALYLYSPEELNKIIWEFQFYYELEYKGINRIDLYKDFQIFDNGLKPAKFIHNFLTQKIVIKGRRNFSVYGKAGRKGISALETLKLGTYNSDVYLKLYNKTEEMKINYKEHIYQIWKQSNLLNGAPVFRLEFTIQGNFNLLFELTENINFEKKINFDFLLNPSIISDIYYSLLQKYFVFKLNRNIANSSRLFKYLLWKPKPEIKYKYIKAESAGSTGKSEKMLTNKIKHLLYEDFYKGAIEKKALDVLKYTQKKFNFANIDSLKPSKQWKDKHPTQSNG